MFGDSALIPLPSNALVRSYVKDHGVALASSGVDKENWWPFNIFGGGGKSKGTVKMELENLGDLQYFGVIEVGGQKIKAVVDTGSFELVVFGSNCTICGSEKDLYDPTKSKTSIVTDFQASHSYGSGTTYSRFAMDAVKVGRFSISNQSFWEVYDADMYILSAGNFQSIFGVGPPRSAIKFAQDDDDEVHEELKQLKKSGSKVSKRIQDIVDHYDSMVDLMKNVSSVAKNLLVAPGQPCRVHKLRGTTV